MYADTVLQRLDCVVPHVRIFLRREYLSVKERKERAIQVAEGLKSFRYDTMKVLEIFSRMPLNPEIGVKPSIYVNELLMPSSDRHKHLVQNNDCIQLFPNAPPLSTFDKWDVKPRIVFFNNWQPGHCYESTFSIRNKYRLVIKTHIQIEEWVRFPYVQENNLVRKPLNIPKYTLALESVIPSSKMLKLKIAESEVFELEEVVHTRRLASMVTATYRVRFRPLEATDYQQTITLQGETEAFPIYVLALGPRPIIDFPDRIDIGDCLVNFGNERIIPLKNIGQINATVVFQTIGSVSVNHEKMTLDPNESKSISVTLFTKKLGLINAQIIATYETGERVFINVTANCKRGKVYLDKSEVRIDDTYMGLKCTVTLSLHNDSSSILDYRWLRNQDLEHDITEWKTLCGDVKEILETNKLRFGGLKYLGIADQKEHEAALDRVEEDETSQLRHHFHFIDSCIRIEPMSGTIWPRSVMNFHITFEPSEVMNYTTVAFLEVGGLENRQKVTFSGNAIGPRIVLNVSTIDFGRCFICSTHMYGVVVRNLGLIKGRVKHVPEKLICGGKITCSPSELELLPEETKLVEISIQSNTAGLFVEDVWFQVVESSEKFRCTVQGEIINPRLILDKRHLDFGIIALGFRTKKTFKIHNDSPIPVDITLNVEGDGYMQAVQLDYDYDHMMPSEPKEFTINPQKATINSGQILEVEVQLISNTMRKHRTNCNIYFLNVLLEECSLQVTYETQPPVLSADPSEILMRYAFTDYEYLHEITIINESDLATHFSIIPQQIDFNPYIIYRLDNAYGFLGGKSRQVVRVYIKVLTLKPCKERIKMRVFGLPYVINACTIRAFGMGPVVNPSPSSLSWGQVQVLKEVEKEFSLINVSPIPAYYKITVVKHPDVWRIVENEGSIEPEREISLSIVAKLKDSGKIKDQVWVEIAGSRDIYIDITAVGFGISIVTDPNIFPLYDIGKVFRREKHNKIITITNAGTREHTLLFTTMNQIKKMTKTTIEKEQGVYFKINPYRLNLRGGESQEMTISYKWDENAVLEDTYYCYAIINNQGKREQLGTFTVRATFTDPEFIVEPAEVHFRVDISHGDSKPGHLSQNLKLTSLWGSTLSVECKLNRPFSFGSKTLTTSKRSFQTLELEPNSQYELLILFDPPNLKSRLTKVYKDILLINYKGHTVKTYIDVTGEVNFPNLSIQNKLIDFDCVVPYSEGTYQIQLKNVSPLVVNFDWIWEDCLMTPLTEIPGHTSSKKDLKCVQFPENVLTAFSNNTAYIEEAVRRYSQDRNSLLESSTSGRVASPEPRLDSSPAKEIYIPRNLPTLICDLVTRKYFYDKERLNEFASMQPRIKDVLVDFETQFTGKRPFHGSKLIKQDSSQTSVKKELSSSSTSIEISDNLKDLLGLRSSTDSYELSLREWVPSELMNEDVFKNHDELIEKSQYDLMAQDGNVPPISKIIDINPCQEFLEPEESLIVTFTFSPQTPMVVEGSAICKILGGPDEIVEVNGISFPLQYEVLPKEIINFGFGPFCELWCSSLLVWNKSLKDVHLSVTTVPNIQGLRERDEDIIRLPESVCIYPSSNTLKPFQVSYYRVVVFPGHVGEIVLPVLVQVDNEEPVRIHFVGYSMPHQIHIRIPHYITPSNDIEMYEAIAHLTSSWFQLNLKDLLSLDIPDATLDLIMWAVENEYVEDDWDLLMTKNDLVPTLDDINMAYECLLFEKYSANFEGPIPYHIPSRKGCEVLPYFLLENYVADFGLVIAGTKALYGIPYSNYYPITTILNIVPPEDKDLLDKFGVVLKLVSPQYLAGYEGRQFDIFIRPPIDIIPKGGGEAAMRFDFFFKVTCGATIPVTVKALITIPSLQVPKLIDFEGVKIGYRRVVKFKLKNISKVDCEWFAFITPPIKSDFECWKGDKWSYCPFFVKPVYGYINPRHVTVISVIFEPKNEDPCEVDINFVVNMNISRVKVRLRGYGMEPKCTIRDIHFDYCIPYSEPLKKHLTIYNPCLFPLEIFIHRKDESYAFEQKIFKYLFDYYKHKKICVPSTFYTTRMTNNMVEMFRNLAKTAIKKYVEDTSSYLQIIVRRRFAKSQRSLSEISLARRSSKRTLKSLKSVRSLKGLSTLINSFGKRKITRKGDEYYQRVGMIEEIVGEYLPQKSLHSVITDYIGFMEYFNCPERNLAKVDQIDFKYYTDSVMKDGDIIILHSSPRSHPGLFCWMINKYTGMAVTSIDKEIYAEIKAGKTEESLIVRDMLYNHYLTERNKQKMLDREKRLSPLCPNNDMPIKSLKELIMLAINSTRPKKITEKESTPKSGKTYKTNSERNYELPPTLLNIPKAYLQSMIQRRLIKKIKSGIIVKSLSSKFFSSPMITLEVLLNIFRTYRNLNVVSLYSTINMCLKLDKNLVDLHIIEEFNKHCGQNILEASPSFIKQVGKEYHDQRRMLNKLNPNVIKNTGEKKVKIGKRQLSTTSSRSKLHRRSKAKPTYNHNVLEAEANFATYYKELDILRLLLEDFDRTRDCTKEDIDIRTSFSSKKLVFRKPSFRSITFNKAQPKVDENYGVSLWILNHFPYPQEYQFSAYAQLLSSIESIKKYSTNEEPVRQTTMQNVTEKSYFIIDKPEILSLTEPIDEEDEDDVKVRESTFQLKPCSLPRRKHMKSVSLDEEKAKLSGGAYSLAQTPSSLNVVNSSVGIESLMNTVVRDNLVKVEDRLISDLDTFLGDGSKTDYFTRQLIKPSRYKSWEICFKPIAWGDYADCILFGIGGCGVLKCANIYAGCDIPDISFDPFDVFQNIDDDDETPLEDVLNPCYLLNRDVFHFGVNIVLNNLKQKWFVSKVPLMLLNKSHIDVEMTISAVYEKKRDDEKHKSSVRVGSKMSKSTLETSKSGRQKKQSNQHSSKRYGSKVQQPHKKNENFRISNKSKNTLDKYKTFSSSALDAKCFSVQSPEVYIKAGGKDTVNIISQPTKTGLWSCRYMLSIKNNPKIYSFQAYCCGISIIMGFHPKELNFDEVILYRSATRCFSMENMSKVTLVWKIYNLESFKPQITLNKTEGILKPDEFDAVYITYHAREVEKINRVLTVGVSALEKKEIELQHQTYYLTLKSYSVDISFYFELSGNNHLDLGDIGVHWDISTNIVITNNGVNPVMFKLSLNEEEMKGMHNIAVIIDEIHGFLRNDEFSSNKMQLQIRGEMQLKKVPFLLIEIVDYSTEELVTRIPGYISLQSHFPKFVLSPSQTLEFGDVELGTMKTLELTLENTGIVDFNYKITSAFSLPESVTFEEIRDEPISMKNFRQTKASINYTWKHENVKAFEFYMQDIMFLKKILFLQKHYYKLKKASHFLKGHPKSYISQLKNYVYKRRRINSKLKIKSKWKVWKGMLKYYNKLTYGKADKGDQMDQSEMNFLDSSRRFNGPKLFRTNDNPLGRNVLDGPLSTLQRKTQKLKFSSIPFHIEPSEGILISGESEVIKVYCFSNSEGTFERTYILTVKNASPNCNHVPLYFSVKYSIPIVNLEDFESIFREFEIADEFPTNACSQIHNDGFPYGFFAKNKRKIYFCNTILGCSATCNIYYRSENHIPASINVEIFDNEDGVFTVNDSFKGTFFIPPYECTSIPITFSPKALIEHNATIQLRLETQNNIFVQEDFFSLLGVGNIPILEFKAGTNDVNFNYFKIDFGFIPVKTAKRKMFTVKNVGEVVTEFLFELTNRRGAFVLHCLKDTLKFVVNESLTTDVVEVNTLFKTKPNEEANFEIEFLPQEKGTFLSSLNIHIVHNQFEIINIKFFGEAYFSNVEILGTNVHLVPHDNLVHFPGATDFMEYELNYGLCAAGKKFTEKFILTNNTDGIVRFESDYHSSDLILIPSTGHLPPSSQKEIKACLLANNPMDVSIMVSFRLEVITMKGGICSHWDDSVKLISWLEDGKASLDVCEFHLSRRADIADEPEYVHFSNLDSHLLLHCTATIDIPSLSVEPDSVFFQPVLVGQTVEQAFEITNESSVNCKFELELCDPTSFRSDPVPDIVSFTFGKFDYNMNDLPQYAADEALEVNIDSSWSPNIPQDIKENVEMSIQNIYIRRENYEKPDEWEQLKRKHLSIIYERLFTEETESQVCQVDAQSIVSTATRDLNLHHSSQTPTLRPTKMKESEVINTTVIPMEKSEIRNAKKKSKYIALESAENSSDESCSYRLHSSSPNFTINMNRGLIKPLETVECTLLFTPRHIQTYQTSLKVINKDTHSETVVTLNGTGILPLCHIEIEDVTTESSFPLPSGTKTVYITSMDYNNVTKKMFNVYNITEIPYHFKWYCLKPDNSVYNIFCHSSEGIIPPRGKAEMVFSFFSTKYGTFESLWVLCFKEFNLRQPLLIIGIAREPKVDIEPKKIILKPSLKGVKSTSFVKLINFEESEVEFIVVEESLFSCFNCNEFINVNPMKGKIMPNESSVLEIEFIPQAVKDQLFNPQIAVHSSKKVLSFKVVSKSFNVFPIITCIKEDYEKFILKPNSKNKNIISIGKVNIRMPYTLSFLLKNIGEVSFYFELFLPEQIEEGISISTQNKQGIVLPSNEIQFHIKITALQRVCFKQPLSVKISKGPEFFMEVVGNAIMPVCRFSFDSYDFGVCLIQDTDPLMNSIVLEFYNLDSEPVLLETKGCKEGFSVNFNSLIVEPRATHKILIIFNPTEAKKYYEILKFSLNSISQNEIILAGEGDYLKLEIENIADRVVDFGPVAVAKTVSKIVPIVNKSRLAVEFTLHAQEGDEERSNAKLLVEPFNKKILLKPGASCNVKLSFCATKKLKNFTCAVSYKAYGKKAVLFLASASVMDYEFSLDQSYLLFESTVIGCSTTLKVGLVNSGDLGTRFKFMTQFISEVFMIKPLTGYSPPGSTTVIEVTFAPNCIMQYCSNVLICLLENYHSLTLNIVGVGVKIPLPSAVIKCVTRVREEYRNTIYLKNGSFTEQIIHPIIDGEYFSGEATIVLPPKSTVPYEIIYNPLTQTKSNYHLGSLFCAFNNGDGQLYKLLGTAIPPDYKEYITWYCNARVKKCGKIPIQNWLSSSETFSVKVECLDLHPVSYFEIEANDIICLLPKEKKFFKLKILIFKECQMNFKVTFKNTISGEYNLYRVTIIVEAPLPWPVRLTAPLNERVSHRIALYNPMKRSVIYVFRSPHPDIKPSRKRIKVKPYQKSYLKLWYLPMYKYQCEVKVEVGSYFLGRIVQSVSLEATHDQLQPETVIESNLGVQERFYITFKNPVSALVLCFPFANSQDLTFSETSFNIPPRKSVKMEAFYMPSQLGVQLAKIEVSAYYLGSHWVSSYPVKGICHPPKPQGPFIIKNGGLFKLNFLNILKEKANFRCDMSSQEFMPNVHGFSLAPRQEQTIEVEFMRIKQSSAILNQQRSSCKMTITCTTKNGNVINWVYYLMNDS